MERHVIVQPGPITSVPLPDAESAEGHFRDRARRPIPVPEAHETSQTSEPAIRFLGEERAAFDANAVIVQDAADIHRVDDLWPSLLHRSGAQRVVLRAAGLSRNDLAAVEGGLNAALEDCGCDQGAVGVVTFSVFAAIGLLVHRRAAGRMRLPVATVSRDMSVLVGAAVAGGILGKMAGLLAARVRFLRLRRRLGELLEPNALE